MDDGKEQVFEPVHFSSTAPKLAFHLELGGKRLRLRFQNGVWIANTAEELAAMEKSLGEMGVYANRIRRVDRNVGIAIVAEHRKALKAAAKAGAVNSTGITQTPDAIKTALQTQGVDMEGEGAQALLDALTHKPADGQTGDNSSLKTESTGVKVVGAPSSAGVKLLKSLAAKAAE